MSEDELREIENNASGVGTELTLVAEVRRLRGLIADAGKRCIDETGWCPFCEGHHDTTASRADCPAFNPDGSVK